MSTDHAPLFEIAHHAIATGALNLSQLLGVDIEFEGPLNASPEPGAGTMVLVNASFTGGIEAETTLALTSEAAAQIAELVLTGTQYTEDDILGRLGVSALGEAMNHFLAGIARALSERMGRRVDAGAPVVEVVADGVTPRPSDAVLVWDGTIGPTPGRLSWLVAGEIFEALAPEILTQAARTVPDAPAAPSPTDQSRPSDLGRLADVILDVTVELGRSRLPIKELLALDEGGIIKLGRPAGEPVDLLVNGLATARGEIVVVDGRLGLRVTELIG